MAAARYTNRLANEKSPYLLQHAHNPVDWYPWGEEAFAKARQESKPIFLSVGYSTCHWCHVMEHESFENEDVAKIMNENFVNIKVDREEQPGVDRMYMTYVQLISGGGGWPMSVFLTPELYPFFGGTYFPPEDQMGRPGFKALLKRIAQLWEANPVQLRESGSDTIEHIKSYVDSDPSGRALINFTPAIGDKLYQHFRSKFDAAEGGFGGAPKFPTPVQLDFLLRHATYLRATLARAVVKDKEVAEMSVTELKRAGAELEADIKGCVEKKEFVEAVEKAMKEKAKARKQEVEMVLFTLNKIAAGGIHDHVGNGFHRYSVDKFWHVPHFEKMLYDQAQLLSVFIAAYTITKEEFYAEIARDIIKYVDRDLSHPDGGFYSAEDADSYPHEGAPAKKEGAFCVWERSEINAALPELEANVFSFHYGVRDNGNVDAAQDPHGELTNKNVLIERHDFENTASEHGLSVERVVQILKEAKEKLWKIRATKRPKPHRDDKILTSWNGLMISGLTQSYSALDDKHHLEIAIRAANFIKHNLYNAQTHTLTRSYREGPSEVEGFLDDYSYLIQALLDLYEATFDEDWLQWAVNLQERQNELFWDATNGGYFSVTEKDKSILVRMKDEHDGAEPSGNSVSVSNLLRLANVVDESTYSQMAEKTLQAFHTTLTKYPQAMPAMVSSLLLFLRGTKQIILLGALDHPTVDSFLRAVRDVFMPNRVLLYVRTGGLLARRNETIGALGQKGDQNIRPEAHVCENFTCGMPVHEVEELKEMLEG